jgi:alkylhydroperoxidase/carboxymuconolactone decarboxylase family protein YurZ
MRKEIKMTMNSKKDCGCTGVNRARTDKSEIVDEKLSLLIATGAAMAANCESCLKKIVPDLIEAGGDETEFRMAVKIGQVVKDKPATIMKEAADALTGSKLTDQSQSQECPLETMEPGYRFNRAMLIAAGAAMAANCEPCINQAIPILIEAGIADADIRRAVVIAQTVKDKAARATEVAADEIIESHLAGKHFVLESSADTKRKETARCC